LADVNFVTASEGDTVPEKAENDDKGPEKAALTITENDDKVLEKPWRLPKIATKFPKNV
jgi:hypothetical protein